MDTEELAKWLYDEFDPNADDLPDACDAEYGPHPHWEQLCGNDQEYWLSQAKKVQGLFNAA